MNVFRMRLWITYPRGRLYIQGIRNFLQPDLNEAVSGNQHDSHLWFVRTIAGTGNQEYDSNKMRCVRQSSTPNWRTKWKAHSIPIKQLSR